ncbi:MAG: calreticulin [Lachnospiraceae bacterium]|nr:calreticulin [Lachnospiraceae bacterium]
MEIVDTTESETSNFNLLLIVLLIVVLAAGGGFFAYTKLKGNKAEEARPDPDADYEYEDDGEDGYELPDAYADDSDTGLF